MPIKIPQDLPGCSVLESERIPLIFEERALRQDIRPLQIAILNLMPDKIQTETQLLRALGGTPLQVEVTLLRTASHTSKNTPKEHLTSFYKTPQDLYDRRFDGLIMTGAPVGNFDFEDVTYWEELCEVMSWATTNVYSSFFICWGALAGMKYHYDVAKHVLPEKQFGIYPHKIHDPFEPLTAGFDSTINVPVSRHTKVCAMGVKARPELHILAESDKTGLCLVQDAAARRVFMFNHLEYDAETLKREYDRDMAAGMEPQLPYNYFPDNDPSKKPEMTWRAHRTLLFHNWLNIIYQGTPFDLADLTDTMPGWEQAPNICDEKSA